MGFCFDSVPDRHGTLSYKWDCNKEEFPQRPDAIPMWVADTDFPCPPAIVEAVQKRAAHPIYGYSTLSEDSAALVAAWQEKRNGWKIDPGWITYTSGVVPALSMAVRAFAAPGEGVIIMSPVYYPFRRTIVHNHRVVRECRMRHDGERWSVDFAELSRLAAMQDTKLLILCSPHNPLCRVFTRAELEKIAEICLQNGMLILSDEIHSDLIFRGQKHIPIASLSPEVCARTITATAPSKTFNIAGLQMSAIICSDDTLRERFTAALGFEFIPSVFGAAALQAAYRSAESEAYVDALMDYLWDNYLALDEALRSYMPKIHVQRPEATYLMWLDCRALGLDDEALYRFFVDEAGVGIEIGNIFGGESAGFVRMNIGCTRATIAECCRRLREAYENHHF